MVLAGQWEGPRQATCTGWAVSFVLTAVEATCDLRPDRRYGDGGFKAPDKFVVCARVSRVTMDGCSSQVFVMRSVATGPFTPHNDLCDTVCIHVDTLWSQRKGGNGW